jgi:hypothetical protein
MGRVNIYRLHMGRVNIGRVNTGYTWAGSIYTGQNRLRIMIYRLFILQQITIYVIITI